MSIAFGQKKIEKKRAGQTKFVRGKRDIGAKYVFCITVCFYQIAKFFKGTKLLKDKGSKGKRSLM